MSTEHGRLARLFPCVSWVVSVITHAETLVVCVVHVVYACVCACVTVQLRRIRGHELSGTSLEDLESLESELKDCLGRVTKEKDRMLRERIDGEREQRLCVICQEEEKSCLLLPCRHLCLCKACSKRPELETCPLCRGNILEKIDVYS